MADCLNGSLIDLENAFTGRLLSIAKNEKSKRDLFDKTISDFVFGLLASNELNEEVKKEKILNAFKTLLTEEVTQDFFQEVYDRL